jgi:ABC-type thiamine transport system ATPase subunit
MHHLYLDTDITITFTVLTTTWRTIAQQASSFRPQQVIFTRHNLDDSIDIQQNYHIGVIPTVVMLRNAEVVQRLEDPSEKMLWKYVRKHTE